MGVLSAFLMEFYIIFFILHWKDESNDLTLGNNKIKLVDFVHTYKGRCPLTP